MNLTPIFDGHNDTLLSLYRPAPGEARSFFERSAYGHIDLPRAKAGGFAGGLFAVFLPREGTDLLPKLPDPTAPFLEPLPAPLEANYAMRTTLAMAGLLFRLEAESAGQLRVTRSAGEIEACMQAGVVAAVLHVEGADGFDPELNLLHVLYQAGLRSLGPLWSRPNAFGHGVPFGFGHSPDQGPGLTEAGKALVRECNRLRVMVDCSHLNEREFWDVAAISTAPLVASHSNAHTICPSTRNLTDRQLDAIRDSDGLAGLNFMPAFVRADGRNELDTPLEDLARQVAYLVERLGITRVGIGSDMDGAPPPKAIGDAAGLPRLIEALRAYGFDEGEIAQIAHKNWLRVLRATWGA